MPKTAAAESVRVEIYDQSYNLRGTDPAYIHTLAEYVDLKMRSVAEQTQTVDVKMDPRVTLSRDELENSQRLAMTLRVGASSCRSRPPPRRR